MTNEVNEAKFKAVDQMSARPPAELQLQNRRDKEGVKLTFDGTQSQSGVWKGARLDLNKMKVIVPPNQIVDVTVSFMNGASKTFSFTNTGDTKNLDVRMYLSAGRFAVAYGDTSELEHKAASKKLAGPVSAKFGTTRMVYQFVDDEDNIRFTGVGGKTLQKLPPPKPADPKKTQEPREPKEAEKPVEPVEAQSANANANESKSVPAPA